MRAQQETRGYTDTGTNETWSQESPQSAGPESQ